MGLKLSPCTRTPALQWLEGGCPPKRHLLGWLWWGECEDGVGPSRWTRVLVQCLNILMWVLVGSRAAGSLTRTWVPLCRAVWCRPGWGWSVAQRAVHPHLSAVPAERGQAGAFLGAAVGHSAASLTDMVLLGPAQTVCGSWADGGPGAGLGQVSACKAALSGCP